jgi:H+/gluconate symporter-like permease
MSELVGLFGILAGLGLLIGLSFRGWSVLLLAPIAALLAAAISGQPLLASWTQLFMTGAAGFLAQFFPIFLLGALFGKLMDDSGAVRAIAEWMFRRLGQKRAVLSVVLAGAFVTYGGVSLFVAFFVLVPMAQALFQAANIPRRLIPATIILGTSTFTMSALPGAPAIQNAIPMPFFGTTAFAAPGLGVTAAMIMLGLGLMWLTRAEAGARRKGQGYVGRPAPDERTVSQDDRVRMLATTAREFDPAEMDRGLRSGGGPSPLRAILPLVVVVLVNLLMSIAVLPHLDTAFLAQARWGSTSLSAVAGVWSVVVALAAAIIAHIVINRRHLQNLRASVDAGASAGVLPALSVASLVGFGAVIAALPAFDAVRAWVLTIEGGPLVSLALATNLLAALTGSASGGLTIALDALGQTYMAIAAQQGINPELMHRVATIGSGMLDTLPHNGAVVSLLALCGVSHREGYFDIVMTSIVTSMAALIAVIALGTVFGAF